MKITNTILSFENTISMLADLTVANVLWGSESNAMLLMNKWLALFLMALMALPSVLSAQVVQKDKSQAMTVEYVALIDVLEDGEKYTIEMITNGCFEQSMETLTISRAGNSYLAAIDTQQMPLTLKQMQAVRAFEVGIRSEMIGGCTTTETYILTFRSEKLRFTDASCTNWFGKDLKRALDLSH